MEVGINLEEKLRVILDNSAAVHEILCVKSNPGFKHASYKVYEFYKKLEKKGFVYDEKDLDYCLKKIKKLNSISKKLPADKMEKFRNSVKHLLVLLENRKKAK